ncbi:MAG: putative AGC family protein kinase [Streblomastix strix]|uniref:Putative AGC family protein kinase n=1 Tax=Streblomastix strix TaxID=222440 RepID=A0A5J4WUE2_9EUKA|nr:MAG: putative AGC family protein kinase [Streblomastix strix]
MAVSQQKDCTDLGTEEYARQMGFVCPISRLIMKSPVRASDGQAYEREMIQNVLSRPNPYSPINRKPLKQELLPDYNLKNMIKGKEKSNYQEFIALLEFNQKILRQYGFVPIRPLGHGSFGSVFLSYDFRENQIIATKIIPLKKFDDREWKSVDILWRVGKSCPFILDYIRHYNQGSQIIILTEYANMKTLNIIAKQQKKPPIPLPSYIFRALFKQILVGMQVFHAAGLVHRDIKCDNILLHCPPGSGRVYVKISDFGFSNLENLLNQMTFGTKPYMAPEILRKPPERITQKVDIFSLGVTMIRLITHKYPLNLTQTDEFRRKYQEINRFERPPEIKDDNLWNLLSLMLEFNADKRISAEQALQHPYFQSPEALADISPEQQKLADEAKIQEIPGIQNKSLFDEDPTFVIPEHEIYKFLEEEILKCQKIQLTCQQLQDGEITFKINYELYEINEESESGIEIQESIDKETKEGKQDEIQQNEQPLDINKTVHPHIAYYTEKESKVLTSISFIATPQQLDTEKQFRELNMPLEQIKMYLDNFDKKAQLHGIFEKIMMIINEMEVEQIYRIYFEVVLEIISAGLVDRKMKEYMSGIMNKMIKRLDILSNDDPYFSAIGNIFRYVLAFGHQVKDGEQNPVKEEFERDGTVDKIVQVFLNCKLQDQRINQFAAVAIGGIYKAVQIDYQYGPEIIKFLKEQANPSNAFPFSRSILAISFLAECQGIWNINY